MRNIALATVLLVVANSGNAQRTTSEQTDETGYMSNIIIECIASTDMMRERMEAEDRPATAEQYRRWREWWKQSAVRYPNVITEETVPNKIALLKEQLAAGELSSFGPKQLADSCSATEGQLTERGV